MRTDNLVTIGMDVSDKRSHIVVLDEHSEGSSGSPWEGIG